MATRSPDRLRDALAAMPPGTLVPRDWLVDQLSDQPAPAESPPTVAAADLTISDLARLFGKRPSTVRAWVERGDFPGAYKLNGREWRIPPTAVVAFRESQRRQNGLSTWRTIGRRKRIVPESGQRPDNERSGSGNAED
jgi:hypothetical protein